MSTYKSHTEIVVNLNTFLLTLFHKPYQGIPKTKGLRSYSEK